MEPKSKARSILYLGPEQHYVVLGGNIDVRFTEDGEILLTGNCGPASSALSCGEPLQG